MSQNWTQFIPIAIGRWSRMFDWITDRPAKHKLLVVRYEDIVASEQHEVTRMLQFLDYNTSGGGIAS